MRYITTLSLAFLLLFPAGNSAFAAADTNTTRSAPPAAGQENKDSDLEKQKKQLQKDARELAGNFKDIFRNLTGISKAVLMPFIDNVSQWIQNNYAELSRESRKKLQKSMEELRKQMNNLENQSREKSQELFREFQDLLDSLKDKQQKKEPTTPPELVPA